MKKIVTSLKMSKKLDQAGFKLKSLFEWVEIKDGITDTILKPVDQNWRKNWKCYYAYTLSELLDYLKDKDNSIYKFHCIMEDWAIKFDDKIEDMFGNLVLCYLGKESESDPNKTKCKRCGIELEWDESNKPLPLCTGCYYLIFKNTRI